MGLSAHWGGTYVCMEGPAFSTKAESAFHRALGGAVIGMTAWPEAKLAREAEMCYAPVSLITDYDVWKEGEEVSVEKVVGNLHANAAAAQNLVRAAAAKAAARERKCACASAARFAVFTRPEAMPRAALARLKPLIGAYVKA